MPKAASEAVCTALWPNFGIYGTGQRRPPRWSLAVQNCRISKDVVNGSRDTEFPQNKGRNRYESLPNETEAIRTNPY